MGSSARKKKEKKKDFQKTKLKVGKARPKAANFTDTSFKSRAISVNQQSLVSDIQDTAEQFRHNLSLAATAKADTQRRDALAFLTARLSSRPPSNAVGTATLLTKLLPLITDGSAPVRSQLLKLLRALPADEARHHVEKTLMYIRAGMAHLSTEIRDDALSVMEWVLDSAPDDAVRCPGGWMKTLSTFGVLLGWKRDGGGAAGPGAGGAAGARGWTSASAASLGVMKGGQLRARQVQLLARFLEAGLRREVVRPLGSRAYWDNLYRIPKTPNPFGHLNLYGPPRDEDGEMYMNSEDRQRAFGKRWYSAMRRGADSAKKEGGAVGRAAAGLEEVLKDGMEDYEAGPDMQGR